MRKQRTSERERTDPKERVEKTKEHARDRSIRCRQVKGPLERPGELKREPSKRDEERSKGEVPLIDVVNHSDRPQRSAELVQSQTRASLDAVERLALGPDDEHLLSSTLGLEEVRWLSGVDEPLTRLGESGLNDLGEPGGGEHDVEGLFKEGTEGGA